MSAAHSVEMQHCHMPSSADRVVTLADLTGSFFWTSKAASNIQGQDSRSDKLFLSKYLPFF